MKKGIAIVLTAVMLTFGIAFAQEETFVESFTVTFVENPTTGYTWSDTVSDETILNVQDNGYVADPGGYAGIGGTHSWTIFGTDPGDASVTFVLARQWEGGETAATIVYNFFVNESLMITVTSVEGIPERFMPDKGVVILTANPTTGYEWSYKASAEGILTLEKDDYIPDNTELAGSGGIGVWIFRGAAEGEVTLTYEYARSWEKGEKPEATVTFKYGVNADLRVTLLEVGGDTDRYLPYLKADEAE